MSNYDDIINHPHYRSSKRPHMSMYDRAAQFSPFAALTGYGESVIETARLTSSRIELSDDAIEILNERLQEIESRLSERSDITITYFRPDEYKEGGEYVRIKSPVAKIDRYENVLIMSDGLRIPVKDIIEIDL